MITYLQTFQQYLHPRCHRLSRYCAVFFWESWKYSRVCCIFDTAKAPVGQTGPWAARLIPRSEKAHIRAEIKGQADEEEHVMWSKCSQTQSLASFAFLSAGWEVWDLNVLPLRLPTAQCGGVNLGTPRLPQSFMTPPFASQQLTTVQLSHANRRQQTAAPKTLNQLRCRI